MALDAAQPSGAKANTVKIMQVGVAAIQGGRLALSLRVPSHAYYMTVSAACFERDRSKALQAPSGGMGF